MLEPASVGATIGGNFCYKWVFVLQESVFFFLGSVNEGVFSWNQLQFLLPPYMFFATTIFVLCYYRIFNFCFFAGSISFLLKPVLIFLLPASLFFATTVFHFCYQLLSLIFCWIHLCWNQRIFLLHPALIFAGTSRPSTTTAGATELQTGWKNATTGK